MFESMIHAEIDNAVLRTHIINKRFCSGGAGEHKPAVRCGVEPAADRRIHRSEKERKPKCRSKSTRRMKS